MGKTIRALCLFCVLMASGLAAYWSSTEKSGAPADAFVAGHQITALLSGRTAIGNWNGDDYRQFFSDEGTTYYAVEGKRSTRGKWRVSEDGSAYESWWSGGADNWETYRIERTKDGLAWVDPGGKRYPFKMLDGQQLVWTK